MNKIVSRTAFALVLLTSLVIFLATGSSAFAAHTTASPQISSTAESPQIGIINCGGPTVLVIYSNTAGAWCFNGSGSTPATIPNVWEVCSHNTPGYVTFATWGNLYFGSSGCLQPPASDTVTSVTIY